METTDQYSLAGCVVLYNPDISVIANIETYLKHLDVLYLVDNSEIPNKRLIAEIEQLGPQIIYSYQNGNSGIATALNTAATLAANASFNWLLTMDQDSGFLNGDFFANWKEEVKNIDNIGLIAASYVNEQNRWQKAFSENYIETHYAVTSGNIIKLKIWADAGGFDDKLFIDEVDHDYCLKLRQLGYKVLTSKKIYMQHAIGEYKESNGIVFNTNGKLKLHSPLRYYYISRNGLYLCRKYFFKDFKFASSRFYYLLKTLSKILLIYPDKTTYLKMFFAGVRDFANSKYYKYNS